MERPNGSAPERRRSRGPRAWAAVVAALGLVAPAAGASGGSAAGGPEAAEPSEEIVVTGTRSPRPTSSLPTTVLVLRREALRDAPATTTDGLLRALPSFQTFRRSTSLAADPSSQGLALRGIGPSAVSRALLLDDGVPVNDPFGGWIPWRALPRLGVERIEVAPGGASALYGSFALGGVVALVPRPIPDGASLEAEVSGGERGTFAGALRATRRAGPVALAVEGDALRTDGYRVVAPEDAGPIDGLSGADHAAGTLRVRWDAAPGFAVSGGVSAFAEDQDGGTAYTTSGMRALTARARVVWTRDRARVEAVAYGGGRTFTQRRARVEPDRVAEALVARQEIPSRDVGGSVVLSTRAWRATELAAGADVRRVWGDAEEARFPPPDAPPDATAWRGAEGAQVLGGVFVEGTRRLGADVELAAALRLDGWRNEAARTERVALDGTREVARFAARTATQLSPRVAALWRPVEPVTLRASAYRAFRAPTLNELYRTFQVGTVVTAPNPALGAEVLTGAEAGPEVRLGGGMRLRATGYWNVLEDPATVVTLAAPLPDGATRQRMNLGRARIRGVEAGAAWEGAGPIAASVAWTIADARVTSAPGHEDLVGNALPQDPLHRVTLEVRARPAARARVEAAFRWASGQWEDDRNTLWMSPYGVVDLSAAYRLPGGVEAFAAAENLLDRRYLVGRAGVDTVGPPRIVRVGVRMAVGSAGER